MLGTSIAGTIGGARWGRGGWSWGELEVGTWAGIGVGLNSRGEELWLIYSKLLVWGMHGVTGRISLNLLFGVSCTVLMLSSCVGGGSDCISGEAIAGSSM